MFLQGVQPTAWDLKFRLFGIESRVHPGFWLGGLLFAQTAKSTWELLAGVGALFVSIMVHELGHALCGKYYGDKVPSITLHMMGGYYTPGSIGLKHGQQIWMLIWGPLAGFILGAIAVGVAFAMLQKVIPYSDVLWTIVRNTIWICMIWGVVNLFPIFPLDGGQIFREIVRWKFPSKDDAFCYKVSMIVALMVSGLAIWLAVTFGFGIITVILFLSLAYQNYQFYQMEKNRRGVEDEDGPKQPWEQDADWWKKQ